jgi:hypothetical protein
MLYSDYSVRHAPRSTAGFAPDLHTLGIYALKDLYTLGIYRPEDLSKPITAVHIQGI